jgi:hypothetical protein
MEDETREKHKAVDAIEGGVEKKRSVMYEQLMDEERNKK